MTAKKIEISIEGNDIQISHSTNMSELEVLGVLRFVEKTQGNRLLGFNTPRVTKNGHQVPLLRIGEISPDALTVPFPKEYISGVEL